VILTQFDGEFSDITKGGRFCRSVTREARTVDNFAMPKKVGCTVSGEAHNLDPPRVQFRASEKVADL